MLGIALTTSSKRSITTSKGMGTPAGRDIVREPPRALPGGIRPARHHCSGATNPVGTGRERRVAAGAGHPHFSSKKHMCSTRVKRDRATGALIFVNRCYLRIEKPLRLSCAASPSKQATFKRTPGTKKAVLVQIVQFHHTAIRAKKQKGRAAMLARSIHELRMACYSI